MKMVKSLLLLRAAVAAGAYATRSGPIEPLGPAKYTIIEGAGFGISSTEEGG